MKVYISTDLEGVTGVFKFSQTRDRTSPEFKDAMRLLMQDVAAVAEGLREGGADEIYAMDGHDGGNNFPPDLMAPGVCYVTGSPRGRAFWGLDETFCGVVLLGYHAKNGTPDGVLHHTQSSMVEAKYWYDDVERGEMYQHAVIAAQYGVPIMLVTGDEATCREARETFGDDVPTVAVKKGISREAAVLLAPAETRALLRQGARRAMEALPRLRPFDVRFPVKVRMRRIGPNPADHQNPYFIDTDWDATSAADIISKGER